MTIAAFHILIDAYQQARQHTRWVIKNLNALPFETADHARAAYGAAMDQETAALREVIAGAREMLAGYEKPLL